MKIGLVLFLKACLLAVIGEIGIALEKRKRAGKAHTIKGLLAGIKKR